MCKPEDMFMFSPTKYYTPLYDFVFFVFFFLTNAVIYCDGTQYTVQVHKVREGGS